MELLIYFDVHKLDRKCNGIDFVSVTFRAIKSAKLALAILKIP